MKSVIVSKPWLQSYHIGNLSLNHTMQPYPKINLYEVLEQSAHALPDHIAVSNQKISLTYSQLKDYIDRLAVGLTSCKISKGDHVSTIVDSSIELIVIHFALMKLGAIHVLLNPLQPINRNLKNLSISKSKMLIIQEKLIPDDLSLFSQIKLQYLIEIPDNYDLSNTKHNLMQETGENFSEGLHVYFSSNICTFPFLLKTDSPALPKVPVDPFKDVALILFTGGTSGIPKGAMLTHMNLSVNIFQTLHWMFDPLKKLFFGKESAMVCVPIYHMYGLWAVYECISLGMQIWLMEPRSIDAMVNNLVHQSPLMLFAVPTHYIAFIDKAIPKKPIFYFSGTAPLLPPIRQKFTQITGCPICDGLGSTETCGAFTLNLSGFSSVIQSYMNKFALSSNSSLNLGNNLHILSKSGIGVPLPDVEIKIIDPISKEELPHGHPGELCVRSPQNMVGYWNEFSSPFDSDKWLPMGDIVMMDDDGYLQLVDRVKDMINVSGNKVYGRILDQILCSHPGIALAAVIGIPDPFRPGSERIKAFVQINPSYPEKLSSDELKGFLRDKIPRYALPETIEFCDQLPLTSLMKLDKKRIRARELKKSFCN